MKVLIKSVLAMSIIAGLAFYFPASADAAIDAARNNACAGVEGCSDGASTVSDAIKRIINLLTIIVGIVAVIMIIINGFRMIASNGDSNTVASARNGIIYAIVGLIVVVLAQVIVRFTLVQVQ